MAIRWSQFGMVVAAMLAATMLCAQEVVPSKSTSGVTPQAVQSGARPGEASQTKTKMGESVQMAPPKMPVSGEQLDRMVAIVNGSLILDSDVDEERRLQAMLPYGESRRAFTRERAIERLINRELILEQANLQPGNAVADDEVTQDIANLRKTIPGCKSADCASAAGWKSYLASQGFTQEEFSRMWKQRMEVLAFIQERFQLGVKITPEDVKAYYETKMLPVYRERGVTAPALATISTRIQEVLLQEQVSGLLNDWLNSLRSQGSIVVLHPGEAAP
ncbi:MAG: SurA N-terminal domain-containing protein [Bryocella sp.]